MVDSGICGEVADDLVTFVCSPTAHESATLRAKGRGLVALLLQ